MTIVCQFRVVKWTKKPRNLSSGAIASEKLATHELKYDEVCPIDSRHVLCFDEHGHSYALGNYVSCSRRSIVKRSLNSIMSDRSLKNHSSNWVQAKKSDNKFKSITCKKQEVYCAAGMRGNKCIWIPCLTKEECPLKTVVVGIKGLWLGQHLNPNSNVIGCVFFSQKREHCYC